MSEEPIVLEETEETVIELTPEQTDNRPRPEDGEQDVSQDPNLDYSLPDEPVDKDA